MKTYLTLNNIDITVYVHQFQIEIFMNEYLADMMATLHNSAKILLKTITTTPNGPSKDTIVYGVWISKNDNPFLHESQKHFMLL